MTFTWCYQKLNLLGEFLTCHPINHFWLIRNSTNHKNFLLEVKIKRSPTYCKGKVCWCRKWCVLESLLFVLFKRLEGYLISVWSLFCLFQLLNLLSDKSFLVRSIKTWVKYAIALIWHRNSTLKWIFFM